MDYKESIEKLKNLEAVAYGYNINGEVLGMDCSDFEQIMVDAADVITELSGKIGELESENQTLKKLAETGKSAIDTSQRLSQKVVELVSKTEELEKQLFKVTAEKNTAVEQLHHCENNCDYCANKSMCDKESCFGPSPRMGEPSDYWQWDKNA